MEKNQPKINLTHLFHSVKTIMHSILGFLDTNDITALCNTYATNTQSDSKIAKMLAAYLYLQKHMIATDRSFYYNLYDSTRFREFQNSYMCFLIEKCEALGQLEQKRTKVMTQFRSILSCAESEEMAQSIEQLADDPEIPMGKLLRENIGAGCTSQFQYFLVGLGCEQFGECVEEEFQPLQQFLQSQVNKAYIKQFIYILKDPSTYNLRIAIHKLRMLAHEINCENASSFTLPNNQLHNLIVCFFVLAEELTESAEIIVDGIEDPTHRLLQLMLRYSMFRNFVISVQEKFSFLFRIYSELYAETFPDSEYYPQFNFWRPALAKWFLRMNKFHRKCNETFNMYLLSQRLENAMQVIQQQAHGDYASCSTLVNKIILDKNGLNPKQSGTNAEIEDIISEEMDVLVREYSDYMMDMSIDQCTVNWCGHTQQRLNFPFQEFSNSLMEHNYKLIKYLVDLGPDLGVAKQFIQKDLEFLQNNSVLKTKNLREIQQQSNQFLLEKTQGSLGISFQLQNIDEELQFFNGKRKISIEIQNQRLRDLSQIVPDFHLQEKAKIHTSFLNTTGSTNNQSGMNEQSKDFSNFNEYVYQSEGEEENYEIYEVQEVSSSQAQLFMTEEDSQMVDQSQDLPSTARKLIN